MNNLRTTLRRGEAEELITILSNAGLTYDDFLQMHYGALFQDNSIAESMVMAAKQKLREIPKRTRPTFDYSHISVEEEDPHSYDRDNESFDR